MLLLLLAMVGSHSWGLAYVSVFYFQTADEGLDPVPFAVQPVIIPITGIYGHLECATHCARMCKVQACPLDLPIQRGSYTSAGRCL